MKHKYVLIRSFVYERKALENYINNMVLKGWHVDRIGSFYLRFKEDNKKTHYSVLLMESQSDEDKLYETKHQKSFKKFMEDFDMKFICGYGLWQIFETKEDINVYNDEISEFNYVNDLSGYDKKELRWQMGVPIILAICLIVSLMNVFKTPVIERITLDILVIILWVLMVVGSACVLEERLLLSKYGKKEELESNPKVLRFRFIYTLIQASVILMFGLDCGDYGGV